MTKSVTIWFYLVVACITTGAAFIDVPKAVAASAAFYISPSSGSYTIGDTISASVMIDSAGQAINAGEGSISYPNDKLEYQSVSTTGSIFTFWTSGPSGNQTGVSFGGGLSSPGYSGSSGKVLTVTWKAKAVGTATINTNGSKILANDGSGTNVYGSSSGATFEITAAGIKTKPKTGTVSVSSPSHPDQNRWYNNRTVSLTWSGGNQGYVYGFDQSSNTDPNTGVTKDTSKVYDTVADGVWYFHIKAKTDSGFTAVSHFRVQIDTTLPDVFSVTVSQEGGLTNPRPKVTFESKDAMSGIDHYEASINGGAFFAIKSGEELPKQRPGNFSLVVRAIDKAGNIRESNASFKIEGIDPPVIFDWNKTVGLLEGMHFIGEGSPNDVIHVFLNDKEVDHFTASDKRVAYRSLSHSAYTANEEKIAWEYIYSTPLFPGTYSFKFSRTNIHGADSALTESFSVTVSADMIKLNGQSYSMTFILRILFLIILILLVIIAILSVRIHYLVKAGIYAVSNRLKKLFSKTETAINKEISRDIPEQDLTKDKVIDIKKNVSQKIDHIIEDAKDDIP